MEGRIRFWDNRLIKERRLERLKIIRMDGKR